MKNLSFFILTASCLSISLMSCQSNRPISKAKAHNNETYQVEYLFEHEGCKIYRFEDRGNYVYFTNCNSDITSIKEESDSTKTIIQNYIRKK